MSELVKSKLLEPVLRESVEDYLIAAKDAGLKIALAELYLKAIEAIGVNASEAIAFEDSLNGLMAARKAGLHCVIVPNSVTAHLPFEDYSLRLSSMRDMRLEDVVNQINDLLMKK